MLKVDRLFLRDSFERAVKKYKDSVVEIGLWKSEEIFFQKHVPRNTKILDIGCGAGRTTFGLQRIGYRDIVGLDLSTGMVRAARGLGQQFKINVHFQAGDACSLAFQADRFGACLFSFNGIMQIPRKENRMKAMAEIKRVLVPNGVFIFTTHDREIRRFQSFWLEESKRWRDGEQDKQVFEFGDRIIEGDERSMFIHFPDRQEVIETSLQ